MINVGLIGYGYWGPNLARNFNANPNCKLLMIADMAEKRRKLASSYYPGADVVAEGMEIIKAKDIDVVAIATPVFTHFELAKKALENGKDIFVEKPITSSTEEAERLIEIAEKKKQIVMVDHTFLFTGAVRKIKEIMEGNELGNLLYYDSVRVNLGLFQHDINVIWDLAPHDFSIMDYIIGDGAKAISAVGAEHYNRGLEDVAYITVYFTNNLLAHFHLNWLSPVKVRKVLIGGEKQMLVWDDLNPDESVKVYNKGVNVRTVDGKYNLLAEYRVGSMYAPVVPRSEALQLEVAYLVECLQSNKKPHNDAVAGLRVVKLLEASDKSLKLKGAPVTIE